MVPVPRDLLQFLVYESKKHRLDFKWSDRLVRNYDDRRSRSEAKMLRRRLDDATTCGIQGAGRFVEKQHLR
jgi:hypothetical protein